MELCCPRCRRPDRVHALDEELRCPGCDTVFPSATVDEGPSVAVLLEDDEAQPALAATQALLTALDHGPGFAEHLDEALLPYVRRLSTYGGAHWGRWAEPPLPVPDLAWISGALDHVAPLPDGPILILGAATAGEVLALPSDREVVALDGSVPLLGFASGLAAADQWMPVETTPHRYTARRVTLPEPVRARLQQVTLLAADAREPPLPVGRFALVVALNLIDSISHPRVLLHQARALLAPGGALLLSSPYQWDDDVTPPARRLDADRPPHADHTAWMEQRLSALVAPLRLRWRAAALPWLLRIHDRLVCHFDVHATLWQ